MILPCMVISHFKLKYFLIEFITFHLDACICIEHAHPSYAHIVFQMLLTHWGKLKPKYYAYIVYQCFVSSLWREPTRQQISIVPLYVRSVYMCVFLCSLELWMVVFILQNINFTIVE
jgi:hypothetical protein